MHIPEWFVWLQGAVTTILVPICAAALKVLWQMRQELTTLNVKMEFAHQLQTKIDQLQDEIDQIGGHVNAVKADGLSQIPHLRESLDNCWKEIEKLRKNNHHQNNQLTTILAKLDIAPKDVPSRRFNDSDSDS